MWKLDEHFDAIEKQYCFIDNSEAKIFEYYMNDPAMILDEMAGLRGYYMKVDPVDFSFYISSKEAVHNQHGIRVKIQWNPVKLSASVDGYMCLHGNYKYVAGSHKYKPTAIELKKAENFFRYNKVLIAAVWEEKLDSNFFVDYFNGRLTWKELLSNFNLSGKKYFLVNHALDMVDLERIVRENKIFNMND